LRYNLREVRIGATQYNTVEEVRKLGEALTEIVEGE
jgi:selenocysteine lyase/cysteine desulfurase